MDQNLVLDANDWSELFTPIYYAYHELLSLHHVSTLQLKPQETAKSQVGNALPHSFWYAHVVL